jgi:ATP-binding cassette subfamily C protein CydCD
MPPTLQGLGEIVAFQRVRARGEEFAAKAKDYLAVRVPFLRDLTLQSARQEVATGLGGLAVVLAGAWLAASGRLDGGMLPLLTLLAMSAFVPVWEIAQVGRQLADTLGAARRVYAVHGARARHRWRGVGDERHGRIALEMSRVSFAYPTPARALTDGASAARGQHRGARRPSGAGKTTSPTRCASFRCGRCASAARSAEYGSTTCARTRSSP